MNNLASGTANWFYVRDGRRQGPFDRAGLVRELLSLETPEGVLVWRTGLATWTRAGSLDELKRELPPPLPGVPGATAGASSIPVPDLPGADDLSGAPEEDKAPGEGEADGGSAAEGDLVAGANEGKDAAEGQTASELRRRRRRHRKPRTAGLPSYLVPLVLLFLAVMLGLWFLLRRMNEVPPGRIIQQGDATGSRSAASPG